MALEDALARVPGLAGYLGQEQFTQQRQAGDLANLQRAQTLQQHFATQQRERGLRDALSRLGPDAKEDDVIRAITPFVGADTAFKAIESKRAREAQLANTREMAMARLAQQASQFDRKQMTAEQRLKLDEWYKKQMGEIAAGRAAYDLPPDLYQRPAAPQNSQTGVYNFGGGKSGPLQAEPTDAQAIEMWKASGAVQNPSPAGAVAAQGAPAPAEATPVATAPAEAPVAAPEQPAAAPQAPDAGNLDARDLAARAVPPVQGAPVARGELPPTAKKVPTLADAPKEFSPRDKAKWLQNQLKPGIAGAGELSPRALRGVAEQFLAGDNTAAQGYARSATAKIALTNAIWDLAAERGMDGNQVAAKVAEFQGVKAGQRSLGTRGALIQIAANEANQMADVVLDTSKEYARSKFVPFNYVLNAYENNIGDPKIREFGAAINTFVNAYARAVNPTGVGTVSDKQHARELLSTVQSPDQVEGVIKVLKREMEIAKRAPQEARESMYRETAGGGKSNGGWRVVR